MGTRRVPDPTAGNAECHETPGICNGVSVPGRMNPGPLWRREQYIAALKAFMTPHIRATIANDDGTSQALVRFPSRTNGDAVTDQRSLHHSFSAARPSLHESAWP